MKTFEIFHKFNGKVMEIRADRCSFSGTEALMLYVGQDLIAVFARSEWTYFREVPKNEI